MAYAILSGQSGSLVSIFIQDNEPTRNNCIWIKPISQNPVSDEDAVLNLTGDTTGYKYFAEIDGVDKAIENAVNSDAELSPGKYSFEIF